MKPLVITIGRQYASGGKDIATALAQRLGVPCYDKELLAHAARRSNFSQEIFENHDEKPSLSNYYLGSGVYSASHLPLNHQLFIDQLKAIRTLAARQSCVFVGRCADYALTDHPNCLNVFIHADLEARKERAQQVYGIAPSDCEKTIAKQDKQRAKYYSFYSAQKWGEASNYDITLNSAVGVEQAVDIILHYAKAAGRLED